jgi:putative ABC transport system permease protein
MGMRVDVVEGGKIAVLSLRANRLRTLLTTVGIGIGVCTLLAIVGIIQGLNTSFADQLSSLGGNSMYVTKFPWIIRGDFFRFRNRRDLTPPLAETLRDLPSISAVAPMTGKTDEVTFSNLALANVKVQGTTGDFPAVSGWEVTSGRFLNEPDNDNLSFVTVLGADVADGLFPTSNPLGQSIRIGNRPFRVIGTMARKGKVLGQNQDLAVYVPLKTFLSVFGKKRQLTIGVAVAAGEDILKAQDQVEVLLRRARSIAPEKESDFSINRPEQLANTYAELTGALYGVAMGVGLITLLVGGIGIMNVMGDRRPPGAGGAAADHRHPVPPRGRFRLGGGRHPGHADRPRAGQGHLPGHAAGGGGEAGDHRRRDRICRAGGPGLRHLARGPGGEARPGRGPAARVAVSGR